VEDAAGDRTRPNLKIQDGCIIAAHSASSRSCAGAAAACRPIGWSSRCAAWRGGYREIVAEAASTWTLGQGAGKFAAAGGPGAPPVGGDGRGTAAAEFRGADGFFRRPAGPHGGIAAPCQTRSRAVAKRLRQGAAPHASQVPSAALCRPGAPGAGVDARCRHRRRRDGGISGRDGCRFEDSRQFIESLPFTYLHVFTYSERPGTPAAEEAAKCR